MAWWRGASTQDRKFDLGYIWFLFTGLGSYCWVFFVPQTKSAPEPETDFGFGVLAGNFGPVFQELLVAQVRQWVVEQLVQDLVGHRAHVGAELSGL